MDSGKDRDILAAARDLLFQRGPQAVTMEAVAALAGVSKVTVYSRHATAPPSGAVANCSVTTRNAP